MNASSNKEGNAAAVGGARSTIGADMIEDVDQRLKDWVGTVLTGAAVSLSPPVDQGGEPLVSLYLLDLHPSPHLHPSPPAEGPRSRALQILLRYLVTTSAQHPQEAHSMLWALVFAAMEEPGFEVDLEPVSASLWTALGGLPRPAFMLRLPLRFARPQEDVKYVQAPIEMQHSPMAGMGGVLMGPNDIPIANARVELPAQHLSTRSDAQGRFWFAAVPAKPAVKHFRIQARGRDFTVEAECKAGDQEPLIIHINPGEA